MGQGRVMAVLFTDVVGSTDRNERLGPEQADALRRGLDETLDAVVLGLDGSVVKHLGDGLMAVFESPSAAVQAAIDVHRASRRVARQRQADDLALRVGVALGEVVAEGDDWHGAAVVEAARLCDGAHPGTILVTDSTLILARGEFPTVPRGLVELKGMSQPVAVSEISWSEAAPTPALPPGLSTAGLPFGGRHAERDRLRARWKEAAAGRGGLVLLAGEPGVGKTRLAAELATEAMAEGALVVLGRNDEDLVIPYQPFVEAIGHLLIVQPPATPAAGLNLLLGTAETPMAPDQAERLVVETISETIAAVAEEVPVLLVLDDLHWARPPTLVALHHLLRAIAGRAVLIVGTYRDTDVDRTRPFGAFLGDLRRDGPVDRLELRGLDADEVTEIVAAAAGYPLEEDGLALAGRLQVETAGNAFFIGEVLAHLVESGALVHDGQRWTNTDGFEIPEGIRDVVGRRLTDLGATVDEVLSLAAVIGRSFSLTLLAELHGGASREVEDAVDVALRARLVVEDSAAQGRYAFAHALVRQTLLAELTSIRRARMHAAVAEALALCPSDRLRVEVAHHALEGAAVLGGERSLALVATALAELEDLGAPLELVDIVDRAEAMARDLDVAGPELVGLLDRAVTTAAYGLGDRDRSRAYARRLIEIGRERGNDEAFVSGVAALHHGTGFGLDPEFVTLLPEALVKVRPGSWPEVDLRYAQATMATYFGGEPDAVTLAGQLRADVDRLLGSGAVLDHPVRGPSSAIATRAMVAAMSAYAAQCGPEIDRPRRDARHALEDPTGLNRIAECVLRLSLYYLELRSGDVDTARTTVAELEEPAGDLALFAAAVHQNRAALAMLVGDLDDVETMIDAVGAASGDEAMFAGGCLLQRRWLAHLRGEDEGASDDLGALALYSRSVATFFGVLAARTGDTARARALAEDAWKEPLDRLDRSWAYPGTLHLLGELAADLGDVERGAEVEAVLAPFDGQFVILFCTNVTGTATATLGRLAALRGDLDTARERLGRALAFEEAAGAEPLAAVTRRHLAAL